MSAVSVDRAGARAAAGVLAAPHVPIRRAARLVRLDAPQRHPARVLLPALVAVVLVQSLSPAAQRVPTGAARFALGGGWATTSAGGIHGYGHWFTTPVIGWLQLGALDRLLLGGERADRARRSARRRCC